MGLDMYAEITAEEIIKPVDFEVRTCSRLHQWRKHPNLHGWMEELYREKGGTAESFNCVSVALTLEDFKQLEADILNRGLPTTTGFFFGYTDGSEVEDDLTFNTNARKAITEGYTVFYTSWW